jgi:phenylpropionate dioxygenase-like ring-hydroxylating dioxygenase large terminal subunit
MRGNVRKEPHPISGAIYEEAGDGLVRVEDRKKAKHGLFKWDGTWLEGELTYADPHMLYIIGGPDLPPDKDIFWTLLPPVDEAPRARTTGNPGREGSEAATQRSRIVAPYTGDPGKQTEHGMRSASYIPLEYFLDNDRRPGLVPEVYRRNSPLPGGPRKVRTARFYKKEFHDLEVERLWKKTWQMACREDDIPEIGDYIIYKIASLSYLIVRTAEREFKAYVNACLHRGRELRACDGKRAREFRCSFHGWSWRIDGSLQEITTEWDFPGVREDVSQLAGAKLATWAGFIFINPDPDAMSLEEFMGPEMIAHYRKARLENRYKHAHVARVIRANWKVTMEAFLEAYHSIATHPQLLLSGGDCADTRYDVFGNWARLGHAGMTVASPQRGIIPPRERALEAYRHAADFNRDYLRGLIGVEADQYSDAELVEQSFNNLFPNFSPWGGLSRVVYRFRPHGDNPDESLMEAMLLAPWPAGKPKPPPQPIRYLSADEPWTNATELGALTKIFEQDCANLAAVQRGLKSKQPDYVWYSAYQESVIRNFHANYERALGLTTDD